MRYWPFLLFIILFFTTTLVPIRSYDIFIYFAIAREMLTTGSLPNFDPFIHSIPNYQWNIAHAWLSYHFFYGLFLLGGWQLTWLAQILINFSTIKTAISFGRKMRVPDVTIALLACALVLACNGRFSLRSSIFSDLFIGLTFTLTLLNFTHPTRLIYALPLIFLIWVNTHPGFFIGLFLLTTPFLFDLSLITKKRGQHYLVLVMSCGLVCLINPQGLGGLLFPLKTLTSADWGVYRDFNYEWLPTYAPKYRFSAAAIGFYFILVLAGLALASKPQRQHWPLYLLYLFFAYFGFSAIRHISWAAICLVILSFFSLRQFNRSSLLNLRTKILLPTMLIIFFLGLMGYLLTTSNRLTWWRQGFSPILQTDRYPSKAAEFLVQHNLKDGIFNDHGFGAYLTYALPRDFKIFIHGFIDDQKFIKEDYLGISENEQQFNRLVDKHHLEVFVMNRMLLPKSQVVSAQQAPYVYTMLATKPEWVLVHIDQSSLIFVKNIPKYAELIHSKGMPIGVQKNEKISQ